MGIRIPQPEEPRPGLRVVIGVLGAFATLSCRSATPDLRSALLPSPTRAVHNGVVSALPMDALLTRFMTEPLRTTTAVLGMIDRAVGREHGEWFRSGVAR